MTISIKLGGLSEAEGTIKSVPSNLERNVILQMSQRVYDESFKGASRHSKTGALLQSLENRKIPNGREVRHDPERAPHAFWLNVGTRPHKIYPKDKKALRWVSGNSFIFAKFVNHPGYRGDAYMLGALTTTLREFQSIVDRSFKESP